MSDVPATAVIKANLHFPFAVCLGDCQLSCHARQVREAQGIKETQEDRRRDRNRKAMADAYDKSSTKVCSDFKYGSTTTFGSLIAWHVTGLQQAASLHPETVLLPQSCRLKSVPVQHRRTCWSHGTHVTRYKPGRQLIAGQ